MTKKIPSPGAALDRFTTEVSRACTELGVTPVEGVPPETRGRWRPHSEKLHTICTDLRGRGGRFVAGLPFEEEDMAKAGSRYQVLCGAEQVLEGALRNIKATKEDAKDTMLDQSGQVVTTLTCQADDPRTPAKDKTALRTLAAPALGLINESTSAQTAKFRTTRGRNAGFRATIAELSSENSALRESTESPPAPRSTRRRAPR